MTKQEMAQAQANSARDDQMQSASNGPGQNVTPFGVPLMSLRHEIPHDDIKRVALDAALQFCGGANATPAGDLIVTAKDIEAYLRGAKA